jgi:hypothetical protein
MYEHSSLVMPRPHGFNASAHPLEISAGDESAAAAGVRRGATIIHSVVMISFCNAGQARRFVLPARGIAKASPLGTPAPWISYC